MLQPAHYRSLVLSCGSVLLLATTLPAQARTQFVERIKAGTATRDVLAADVSGDGAVDLLLSVNQGVLVRTNDGTGRFRDQLLPLDGSPNALAAGDIDGDGDIDIYAATGSTRYILRNAPAGWAIQLVASAPPAGAAQLVDLDGDGDLDLVRTELLSPLRAALNDGNGNFVDRPILPTASTGFISSILAGDLNEDGIADIIGYNTSGSSVLALSTGPARYMDASANLAGIPATTGAVLGDFDGDGHLDLATLGASSGLYLGSGTGQFQRATTPVPGIGLRAMVAVDLDEDGDLDIAGVDGVFQGTQPVYLLINHGSVRGFLDETAGRYSTAEGIGLSIAAADLDGDRDVDLYVGASILGLFAQEDRLLVNRHVQVEIPDPVQVGGHLRVVCARQPGYGSGITIALVVFGEEAVHPVTLPFGTVHVDAVANISLPFLALTGPVGIGVLQDPVPADPSLSGLSFAFQALFVDLLGAAPPRLTNFERVTVR